MKDRLGVLLELGVLHMLHRGAEMLRLPKHFSRVKQTNNRNGILSTSIVTFDDTA